MPATLGILGTAPTGTLPTGGVLQELSVETTKEVKTLKNKSGITVDAVTMGYVKKTTSVRGYGDGASLFGSIADGAYSNGKKLIEMKHSESNEDFYQFEATYVEYI